MKMVKHFMTREKFYPTLFVNSKRKSKYKTLTGEAVEPVKPGTVRDCREFIKVIVKLKTLIFTGMKDLYINISLISIQRTKIKFDIEKIKLTTIDIEVKSENGFPDVESAAEEILLILNTGLYNKTDSHLGSWCI